MSISIHRYSLLSRSLGVAAAAGGLLVLIGWQFGLPLLTTIVPGAATMKPITAVCFTFIGIALWLRASDDPASKRAGRLMPARALSIAVLAIGVATLAEHLLHVETGIDELLFPQALAATGVADPGLMAPATALNMALLGAALLLFDIESSKGNRPSHHLAIVVAFISLIALLSFVYGVEELHRFAVYSTMAIHSAALCVIAAVGILFARADRGAMAIVTSPRSGGIMARRILPVAIILPFIVGWIRLAGERAGLYGTELGLALFATANIMIFTIVVWRSARSLNRIDEERRSAEDARRASQRRFRAAIEQSADAITLLDANLNVLYSSPAAAAIGGFSEEELMARTVADPEHPSRRRAAHESFRQVLDNPGRPIPFQWEHGRQDGGRLWLEGTAINLLDDPDVGAVVVNYRDITPRKLAEMALRESEQRFSATFHASPAGMALLRFEDLRYIDANETWLAMIGYSRDEVIGHTAEELGVTDPADRADRIARIEATGKVFDEDVTLRTKEGETRACLVSAQLLTMRSEQYLLGVYIDITDRKRAEAARARLEEQLLQSQKMEALGTLASGIAHDFNNVLTAIIGNARLARAALPPDHQIQQSLTEVYNAGVRAADLVRRILSFSRQQEPKRQVLKLQPVVEEAVEILRATLPAMIRIRTTFAAGLSDVAADPVQIHQVIMNLGTNAAHAIGDRAGLIEIRIEDVTVDESMARAYAELNEGEYVRLSVSDDGSGMEPDVAQRIFEPFFTTKEVGQGTGLGLSVVHGIMRTHGGAVTVYSAPGKGTTFHLYFPATREKAAAGASEPNDTIEARGERILYVDDEIALVTIFTMMLEQLGYRVTGCRTPAMALESFQAGPHEFDAVISDLSMPGMSGTELARKLLEIRPDLPIVLMSGYFPETEIEAARRIGVRDFISKPANLESLQRSLQALIHGRPG